MPESPTNSPWQTRLFALFPLALVGVVALIFWLTHESRQHQRDARQIQRDQQGQEILETARASVAARDPHWRLIDFPKRRLNLPPDQDAGILYQKADNRLNDKLKEMLDQGERFDSTIYYSYPCNRRLMPNAIDYLKHSLKAFEECRTHATQAGKLTQGNFSIIGYDEVLHDLNQNDRKFFQKLFFGYAWLKNRPYKSMQSSVVIPVCGQAVSDFLERKPDFLNQWDVALHLATLPNQPGEDILRFNIDACSQCLVALEWMMGQRVLNEADLLRCEKQLQPLLRWGAPLKNNFIFTRAVADYYAEAYQNNMAQVKTDF